MEKNAIIIFVRNPELGKVKTRLAREIGDEKTLSVYRELLQLTHDAVRGCIADRFVYYADHIMENDLWENEFFEKKVQHGNDLGARMSNAFTEIFGMSYLNVLIIGSDCPGITTHLLETAFTALAANEVVIGPALDGGYYLLGVKEPVNDLFIHKKWSTGQVMDETVCDLVRLQKTYALLPVLTDIDTAADIEQCRHLLSG